MGIALDVYRCRIGFFNRSRIKASGTTKQKQTSPASQATAITSAICLLLLCCLALWLRQVPPTYIFASLVLIFMNMKEILPVGNSTICFESVVTFSGQPYDLVTEFVWRLSHQILQLLLLMGGVEANPGPTFLCKECKSIFSSVASYCKHFSIHQSSKYKGILCTAKHCQSFLANQASFATHYSVFHIEASKSTPTAQEEIKGVRCPCEGCSALITSREKYLQHINQAHFGVKVANKAGHFTCIFENCTILMKNLNQFRSHVSIYHDKEEADLFFNEKGAHPPPQVVENPVLNMDTSPDPESLDPMEYDSVVTTDAAPDTIEEDLYPDHAIKDELSKFYLKLEAEYVLPTTTVQAVASEIKLITELIHHQLKRALRKELSDLHLDKALADKVVTNTFREDSIYNIHHKDKDALQLGTDYLRMKHWRKAYKFVEPFRVYLGGDGNKKRYAHFISVKESLASLLEDASIKEKVVQSFDRRPSPGNVFADFTDGSIFKEHAKCHEHEGKKCMQLFLFQDGFDPNAFGGSGAYKPLGFYWTLGNLPPELRSKLHLIQLAYMILEKDTKNSKAEELSGFDRLKFALKPLIDELVDLRRNGIMVDGEMVPVCIMFLLGDSLGQNYIGRFVVNFANAEFSCRFCDISKTVFKNSPHHTNSLRTPAQYDEYLEHCHNYYQQEKRTSLKAQEKRRQAAKRQEERRVAEGLAPSKEKNRDLEAPVSKSAYKKLLSVNYRGLKNRPSPFNDAGLGFHVAGRQPPCLAHDLFEGIIKTVVPKILKHFVSTKKWFDLDTLNKRIASFQCLGSDALDKPKPIKSFDSLSGHAVENWNLLRLLPFIIGDLIQDGEDPFWTLFLSLKEICAYACAPRISATQVEYFRNIISDFVSEIKLLLPECLIPKLHYLMHYPDLIYQFGSLIRLFTLRFESRHMFFKKVMRTCKNYINVTYTMARKYACKSAYDRSCELLQNDFVYGKTNYVDMACVPEEMKDWFTSDLQELEKVSIFGTEYTGNQYLILGSNQSTGLRVGCIKKIVLKVTTNKVIFLLQEKEAWNSFCGYYVISQTSEPSYCLQMAEDLPDYYPLPAYPLNGKLCLSLKHTCIKME